MEFCGSRHNDPHAPPIRLVLEFLTKLFHSGVGYSAVNTARSALSCVVVSESGIPIGRHPLVVRLLKGVFQLRPALPRNTVIWDTSVVLNFLNSMDLQKDITLKDLSLKLAMLLALVTGQRSQTLQLLDIKNKLVSPSGYTFVIGDKVKQTRPGFHQAPLEIRSYPSNLNLCPKEHLDQYLTRTHDIRGSETGLFISYMKPHNRVSSATLSRWVRIMLVRSGIDMKIFTPHSARAAATSKAKRMAVPINTILKTAGWASTCTFAKFYDKPTQDQVHFADMIMDTS